MNNNPVTDTLRLVQKEEGRSTFYIFRRKRTEQYGFCLVIFRGKALLGYIPSTDIMVEGDILRRYKQIGIKDGDTILSVNLGPQPLEIRDSLSTRDGYPRQYTLVLDVCVIDPIKFAQRYVQDTDPVARARTAIEGYIQSCASQWRHDDLNENVLRDFAEQALTVEPNTSLGLKVVKAQKASLPLNPDRAREIEIARKREIEEQEIQAKGIVDRARKQEEINLETLSTQGTIDIEELRAIARRQQEAIDAESRREEELRQRQHQDQLAISELDQQLIRQGKTNELNLLTNSGNLQIEEAQARHTHQIEEIGILAKLGQQVRVHEIEMQDKRHQLEMDRLTWESQMQQNLIAEVGKGTIPALITRIREQIGDDKSSLRGAISDPELQYLLDIISGTRGTPGEPLRITQDKESIAVSENQDQTTPKPNAEDTPVQALPGVIQQKDTIIEIPDLSLKLIHTQLSEEQCQRAGIGSNSTGFIIFMLSEYGAAREGQLMVGDIVVELNGIQPYTVQDLSHAMSSLPTDSVVSLYVLRGEALIEVQVNRD
ncbi:MAG TPA: hypothetical protein VJ761_07240 [Ktedonobacteraceae bacterium]|nr:hypothetical protein [Ktedonobacteraceae bacterium]